MKIQFNDEQKAQAYYYAENKKTSDQILQIIADNKLSLQQVTGIFDSILFLIQQTPVVPTGVQLDL